MNVELFVTSLALTVAVVGAALIYLRGITRRVLTELCASDAGAEFWLRTADVLALAGSLILVIAFGGAAPPSDVVTQIRLTLGLALAGVFVAVVLVSSSIWRNVVVSTDASDAVEMK
ncbi:MAG TPA: hypothetical protein VFU71_18070 [Burkholderiaceae bacterium]|nr:hypothetical protein [Burkholderiaceae bacterium]